MNDSRDNKRRQQRSQFRKFEIFSLQRFQSSMMTSCKGWKKDIKVKRTQRETYKVSIEIRMNKIMNYTIPFSIKDAKGSTIPPIFIEFSICKTSELGTNILNNMKNQEMSENHACHGRSPSKINRRKSEEKEKQW